MPVNKPVQEVVSAIEEQLLKKFEEENKIDPKKTVGITNKGQQIVLPVNMKPEEGIYWLHKHIVENLKIVSIVEKVDASPLDGAVALNNVLAKRFGWTGLSHGMAKGMFGEFPVPPEMISVEIGPNKTVQVPWGGFQIPGINGDIRCGYARKDGRFIFQLEGEVQRNSEAAVHEIATLVREEVKRNSIYKSNAIRVRFRDDHGRLISEFNPMYAPTFMDTTDIHPEEAIYNRDTEELIKVSLHHPVLYTDQFRKQRMPLKQCVLVEGEYGTGKTLAAHVLAKTAVENGWTFIYLRDIEDIGLCFDFARLYEPAIIFVEDVDQLMTGDRDIDMNKLMEMLDGIDAKTREIMVLFTTNEAESIQKGFIRPGRIDTVIPVGPPDAHTAMRLVRSYGRGLVTGTDEELQDALKPIVGRNAAFVREAVERSKRFAVSHSDKGKMQITPSDLKMACLTMGRQLELTDPEREQDNTEEKRVMDALGTLMRVATNHADA